MKIFREETFGGVVYETDTLRYYLTNQRNSQNCEKVIALNDLPTRNDILSAPIRVYFEITQKCNLACKHCFVNASPAGNIGMPTRSVFSVLKPVKK